MSRLFKNIDIFDSHKIDKAFIYYKRLKYIFLDFIDLFKMIRVSMPLRIIELQFLRILIITLIQPVLSIIFGNKKAKFFSSSFFDNHFPLIIYPHLSFFRNKIILLNLPDFKTYVEIYISNVYFFEMIKRRMNIIDVGANVGLYSMLASEKIGNTGKVIAVEPEPRNYNNLIKNIKLNRYKNTICKNIALTNHKGFERLYVDSFNPLTHSLILYKNKKSFIKVPVTTIDKLVKELTINKVDIIKIDAEGAEIPILEGAEKTLKNNPQVKLIIASYHYPSQKSEIKNFLHNRNFRIKISNRDIIVTV